MMNGKSWESAHETDYCNAHPKDKASVKLQIGGVVIKLCGPCCYDLKDMSEDILNGDKL